jgi:hypothetical protein
VSPLNISSISLILKLDLDVVASLGLGSLVGLSLHLLALLALGALLLGGGLLLSCGGGADLLALRSRGLLGGIALGGVGAGHQLLLDRAPAGGSGRGILESGEVGELSVVQLSQLSVMMYDFYFHLTFIENSEYVAGGSYLGLRGETLPSHGNQLGLTRGESRLLGRHRDQTEGMVD